MSSSEDSEVIHRSRHHKKQRRIIESESFDSLEEGSGQSGHYGEYSPLFFEIFGTGHEYDYIYEKEKKVEQDDANAEARSFDAIFCLEYVQSRLPALTDNSLNIELIRDLADSCAPEFLSLHASNFTMCQIYYIYDIIQLFKQGNLRSSKASSNAIGSSTISSRLHISSKAHVSSIPGLLALSEYISNITSRERLHEPSGEIPESYRGSAIDSGEFTGLINQIATNPVFQDAVNLIYEQSKTSILFGCLPSITKDMLYRLYTTDETTFSNDLRRSIIEEAYKLVDINCRGINARLALCGCDIASRGEEAREPSFSSIFDGLDILTNCILSLRGRPGAYAGMFYEKGFCKIVMINEYGEVMSQAAYKEQDVVEIRAFIANANVVCISSNSQSVRYFVQNLDIPVFLYVPRSLSYFNDLKDYSIPYNIAFVVQNPLVYFSRLVHSSSSHLSTLTSAQRNLVIRSVSMSAAIIKPDWRAILKCRFSHTLLAALNIGLSQKYFDYSGISSFANLESIFHPTEFNNLCTFFTLSDSSQPLDGTDVHPKDYSVAGVLCKSAFVLNNPGAEDEPNSKVAIEAVLSNLQQLKQLSIPDDTEALRQVRALLLLEKPAYFSGASDFQIFQDIVPSLDSKATGVISKVGKDFYIVECTSNERNRGTANTTTVYARKAGEYLLNQTVSLDTVESCPHLLSYQGTIVDEPVEEERVFIKHRLFRNVDQNALQKLMKQDNQNVLVRPSSQKDYYVVVCRLMGDMFYSIKVRMEKSSWSLGPSDVVFIHNTTTYSSLDNFIGTYVKGIYGQIRGIAAYKHFFKNEADAIAYIREHSQYIRHAVILSTASPGCVEFLYQNKRVLVLIDGTNLTYRDKRFNNIEEFISYAKVNFR